MVKKQKISKIIHDVATGEGKIGEIRKLCFYYYFSVTYKGWWHVLQALNDIVQRTPDTQLEVQF